MKTISVVIPAYNAEENILITLKSLAKQTDRNFEVLVINDGSTDNTKQVVEEYLKLEPLLNCKIFDQKQSGVSSARNNGIRASSKSYIYFLDSDDFVSSNLIATLKKTINNKPYDIVAWGYNVVSSERKTIIKYSESYAFYPKLYNGIEALYDILKKNKLSIWTGSAIYNRKVIVENNLYFTEDCVAGEDLEFIYKAIFHSHEILFIDKIMSYYVKREGSTINSFNMKRFDASLAIIRVANYFNENVSNVGLIAAGYIEPNHVIQHYMFSFDSNYEFLDIDKGIFNIKGVSIFLQELDKLYPGLHNNIISKGRKIAFTSIKQWLDIKLFILSPTIFINVKAIVRRIVALRQSLRMTLKGDQL